MRKNNFPVLIGLLVGISLLAFLIVNKDYRTSIAPYVIAIAIYALFLLTLFVLRERILKELLLALVICLLIIFCVYLFFNLNTVSLFFKESLGKIGSIVAVVVIGLIMVFFSSRFL